MIITMRYEDMARECLKDKLKQSMAFVFIALAATFLFNPLAIAEVITSETATSEAVMPEASAYDEMVSEVPVDYADAMAVQRVIGGQIYALKSGNHQSAYSYAAPNVQQAFPSVKNFISMVQSGYKPLYQHTSYIFGKNTVSKGEVYQEVIVADETRQLWQFIYTLKQQRDFRWKVTNVVMYPYKGTSV